MRKTFTLLLVAFCLTAKAQNSSTFAPQSQIYITHTTVIETDTGKEATDQTVVISDGKISDVAKSKNLATPTGARIVDGRGKYLIPGLWDMHVHTWDYESTYPLYIANGVTGVRDMFGPPDANKFRAELNKKQLIAPHFYLASPIVDGHPPVWRKSIEVTTPEQGRKVVDDQKEKGADFIKVYSRLTPDSYFAIAAESVRVGIPFEGHVPNQVSAWKASVAKQKSFEHLYGIAIACSAREEELQAKMLRTTTMKERQLLAEAGSQSYSESKCNDLFARLRTNSNWQVPTLNVFRPKNWNDPQLSHDPRLRYFSGEYRDWLTAKNDSRFEAWTPEDFALERQQFDFDKKLTGAMFRAGVPLLAGTDTGNPYCFPGFSLHDELALLVESGLTPLAALQAATRNAAIFMNAVDRYGSVSKGKIADLVLLDADPLQDIHNTTKISEVFLGGKEFDRAALDLIFKHAEQESNASLTLSPAHAPTDPFVGTWKLVLDHSHFEGTVPKDIKLRFLVDKNELREEEELTRSNGTTRTAIFIADFDGQEHPFTMSGETKHKTHAVLWARIDDRTIERRINHDNGLEYTTERLSVSADAQTLTETHFGNRPDGTAYKTVWAFAKRDGTNDAESPVAAQSNLETAQRPSSLQLPPEMQSLERALEGRWSTTEKYEPDEWTPNGGTGYGEEVWQRGPGGFTFREEVHDHTPSGEEFGVGFSWWDRTKGLQGMWCVNTNPQGCDIQGAASGLGPKWDGKQLVIEAEFPRDGKTFSWHEVFSDITPTSFTQTADIGEKGGPLKRWLTIHGTKIAEGQSAAVARKLIMPGPDVQNLMLGAWSTKTDYPPSPANPQGEVAEGTEIWRRGPGGRSVIEESSEKNAHGGVEGIAIAWWDKKAQGQRFVWCDNSNPDGCYVSKEVAKWKGNDLIWQEEQAVAGTNRVYSETFKDITANSFTQILQESEPGQPLQNTAIISALRKSDPALAPKQSMDDSSSNAEAELRAFMDELRRANIQGDTDTVANSITDDYVQTDINGYRQDKTTWLNEYFKPLADLIKAGKFHWDEFERTNLQFRFYGQCAIVTGELHAKGTGAKPGPQHTWVPDPNTTFSGILHFTHVYIKQNGKWMLAALHNQIPPQPAKAAN